MWEKIASLLLSSLLPAQLFGVSISPKNPPPLVITVEPLAVIKKESPSPPLIKAKAAMVIETHSNEPLFSLNTFESLPIASLTKLMTALVVRESLELDSVVTVPAGIKKIGGSKMGLLVGEKITVRNLLKGLLMSSGNDAAIALSEVISGNSETFTELMNQKALALGLEQTHFSDPAGTQDGNISSAFELAILSKQVFKDGFLQSVMREKENIVTSVDGKIKHTLSNTNHLLGTDISERIIAGKTGTTPLAKECLIAFIGQTGNRTTMAILLGSQNRYGEMKDLIRWIDGTYHWN